MSYGLIKGDTGDIDYVHDHLHLLDGSILA